MQGMVEFLVWHGYSLLFAWVLVEQSGLPLPSAPLLAAGALAGNHRSNLAIVIALPIAATAIMDALRYRIGRLQGAKRFSGCAACRSSRTTAYAALRFVLSGTVRGN
jgi:membrane protein DedA with SNARE-associated domain